MAAETVAKLRRANGVLEAHIDDDSSNLRVRHICTRPHDINDLLGDALQPSRLLHTTALIDLIIAIKLGWIWEALVVLRINSLVIIIGGTVRLLLGLDEGLSKYLPS